MQEGYLIPIQVVMLAQLGKMQPNREGTYLKEIVIQNTPENKNIPLVDPCE